MGDKPDMFKTMDMCEPCLLLAEKLDEFSADKQARAALPPLVGQRELLRWAETDDRAARVIRILVAEVERLREFERRANNA